VNFITPSVAFPHHLPSFPFGFTLRSTPGPPAFPFLRWCISNPFFIFNCTYRWFLFSSRFYCLFLSGRSRSLLLLSLSPEVLADLFINRFPCLPVLEKVHCVHCHSSLPGIVFLSASHLVRYSSISFEKGPVFLRLFPVWEPFLFTFLVLVSFSDDSPYAENVSFRTLSSSRYRPGSRSRTKDPSPLSPLDILLKGHPSALPLPPFEGVLLFYSPRTFRSCFA